jgi:hypothetical protein
MTRDDAKRRPAFSMINREARLCLRFSGGAFRKRIYDRYIALQINAVEAGRPSKTADLVPCDDRFIVAFKLPNGGLGLVIGLRTGCRRWTAALPCVVAAQRTDGW